MIKDALKNVPAKPGSYQMFDAHGNILYVGKAKNLKNRLTSYFTGSHDHKTTKMLQSIDRFEYIITNSEIEALILEIDLIKKHHPRYNILLTDDKSYPYIEITRERHPKLIVTRPMNKTSKNLFGPYPNVKAARETLKILHKLYPLRKCHKLPKEPCLYYHLGQCLAPCIHPIEAATYRTIENEIAGFLKGNISETVKTLKDKMFQAAESLEFERAAEFKATIEAIQTTTSKQSVNLDDLKDRDIIAILNDQEHFALETFFVRNGKIQARDHELFPYYLDVSQAVLDYLIQFYQSYPIPKEIITNAITTLAPLEELFETKVITAKRGPKKDLLHLAIVNAEQTLKAHSAKLELETKKTFTTLDELAEMLNIPTPYHIEAFDNSHLFGSHQVSAMVVFKNAKPSKKDYRKFKLSQQSKHPGDTEQMKEVLYRRYQKMLLEDLKRPDLIIVDGGIHQINAAKEILASLNLDIPLAGLVKSPNHKTHHLITTDHVELLLNPQSHVYQLLSRIQEEAHRFAIDYHQNLRQKGIYATVLDTIDGVGERTKKKLLLHFKTIPNMAIATDSEFEALKIPKKTIKNIKEVLNKEMK